MRTRTSSAKSLKPTTGHDQAVGGTEDAPLTVQRISPMKRAYYPHRHHYQPANVRTAAIRARRLSWFAALGGAVRL